MRDSIIQAATEEIGKYGFRKFTIDDIASSLGISKKTVYKYFSSKKELISSVVENHLEMEKASALESMQITGSILDKLNAVVFCYGQEKAPEWIIEELQQYFPEEWEKAAELNELKSGVIRELIQRGVESGELRDDIRPEIICLTLDKTIDALFDYKNLHKYDLTISQAMEDVKRIVFEGILKKE
ncbi:TetR/AcrR family transcriptional regulator [Desulforamulus aquiferis]|uniref:TetR/AcrR family transcriptional regulator n=1 Tax=Desulforamulus aquiferis TaxID=1397668 RepID=A0AAW7ZHH3_9FIRM|nr:TetR/AcrR family transcriptional regulator [Desulforamulus aquiferis]MDO7789152.1 TetR/AcrR family transcriptional regulator [Desulforamulus aquiferis]RYD02669.1 hypothetical protein N752_23735 [Desulforamulus aquiferis]